jgi:predicted nuclease with TOPRIM domain
MAAFDDSDKEKLNLLIQEARELREESRRLHARAESLRKQVEQSKNQLPGRPKNKK